MIFTGLSDSPWKMLADCLPFSGFTVDLFNEKPFFRFTPMYSLFLWYLSCVFTNNMRWCPPLYNPVISKLAGVKASFWKDPLKARIRSFPVYVGESLSGLIISNVFPECEVVAWQPFMYRGPRILYRYEHPVKSAMGYHLLMTAIEVHLGSSL